MPAPGVLDELQREHRAILDAMAKLEAAAGGESAVPRPAAARAALAFLRRFADANHHGKEERALFPRMRRDAHLAAMAELLDDEHARARTLLAGIERALDGVGAPGALPRLTAEYAALLRDHIRREDEMIFPAAEAALDESERSALLEDFRRIERETLGDAGADGLIGGLRAIEA